jgi:hypothetical protein
MSSESVARGEHTEPARREPHALGKLGVVSPSDYRFFDARTERTFRAVAECIVPAEEGSPGAGIDLVVRVADRMLGVRPEGDQKKVAAFLRAIEQLPRLRYAAPFSALALEQRTAVLRFFERTRLHPLLRVGIFGVKTFVLMGYYGSELAWRELHYPGPRDLEAREDLP